jgi:hypothetical protein
VQSVTLKFLAEYMRSISGAQVSEAETERLKKAIGMAWGLGPNVFFTSVNTLVSQMAAKWNSRKEADRATYQYEGSARLYGSESTDPAKKGRSTIVDDWYDQVGLTLIDKTFSEKYTGQQVIPLSDEQQKALENTVTATEEGIPSSVGDALVKVTEKLGELAGAKPATKPTGGGGKPNPKPDATPTSDPYAGMLGGN